MTLPATMSNLFQDRTEAGRVLAGRLQYLANRPDVLVLSLSRGSMPVAAEVARDLRVALDLFLIRPVTAPEHEETVMGAVAPGGLLVLNQQVLRKLNLSEDAINETAAREGRELERIEKLCRADRLPVNVSDKILILVDDGRAVAPILRSAVVTLRQQEPSGIIVALAVSTPEVCAEMEKEAEQVVCLETREPQMATGLYYWHFPEVSDEEVRGYLRQAETDLE